MQRESFFGEEPSLEPNQTFVAGGEIHGQAVGDRTLLDMGKATQRYKLADAYANVRNLEFVLQRGERLQTFDEYLAIQQATRAVAFTAEAKPRPSYPAKEAYRNRKLPFLYLRGDMLILVDKAVYGAVAGSINQYVLDVGRDGYWATVHVIGGGSPADVRSYITKRRPIGVLLVGAVAVPWFEMNDDFHGRAEFPCDLYYMDLDGVWTDPDGNGKFNAHSGNVNPEIWVGRLYTPTANGNDAALINDYFARNHKFRLGALGAARSALAYVDDDWSGFDDCALDEVFPPAVITKYTDPVTTDADLYKAEVNTLRSWVQLCAHSSTGLHALRVGATNEIIQSAYFRDVNPPNAHFYNLFCCGPGMFTAPDYLAGWYIFDKAGGGTNAGLTAVASAKSGSMLMFEDFYRPLGRGACTGDAFVSWWQARGPDHELWERQWFYGLVLLGDPTLTWWKGAVPIPRLPNADDVFDHWPRKMQFRWDPVDIPGVRYTLEVDAFGAINAGTWAEEVNRSFAIYDDLTATAYDHVFVGAQPGRWRVRAKIDGRQCAWSQWNYFRFTV